MKKHCFRNMCVQVCLVDILARYWQAYKLLLKAVVFHDYDTLGLA